MKYFFDTEFIDDDRMIDLISIGIVAEDGREFYAENLDADLPKASDWVKENVINQLWSRQSDLKQANLWSRNGGKGGLLTHKEIANEVRLFCNADEFGKPEFWAYYADYDWVVFCQLFGSMMQLPTSFPKYCNDLKQFCNSVGDPPVPTQLGSKHLALDDARWNKKVFEFLTENHRTENFLVSNFNGRIWAQEFTKKIQEDPTIASDLETMVGWFCNAIMAGYDRGLKDKN